jgi:TPR repeat protein
VGKYVNGWGVPQNYVLAHLWFNLAVARGNLKGDENRAKLAELMIYEQIAEARRLAREWTPKPE